LTPNYFPTLEDLTKNIINFQNRYEKIAKPFEWKFTKKDLSALMIKISMYSNLSAEAA
jgi:hypothetical protein